MPCFFRRFLWRLLLHSCAPSKRSCLSLGTALFIVKIHLLLSRFGQLCSTTRRVQPMLTSRCLCLREAALQRWREEMPLNFFWSSNFCLWIFTEVLHMEIVHRSWEWSRAHLNGLWKKGQDTDFAVCACLRLASHLFKTHPTMDSIFPSLLLLLSCVPVFYSTSPHRGNCRPIRFEPPMLDFHEQWVCHCFLHDLTILCMSHLCFNSLCVTNSAALNNFQVVFIEIKRLFLRFICREYFSQK